MIRYRVVLADPPWRFGDSLRMSQVKRGASAHYSLMGVAELCTLPVREWCYGDAVLALWTPAALLREGLAVMAAWGFAHKQVVVWVKRTAAGRLHFGMGRQFRAACELALVGVRGSPMPTSRRERNVFDAPALDHSRKPDTLHAMLERMYPGGPFLELFARRPVPGWTAVGLECEGGILADLRTWSPNEMAGALALPEP